MDGNYPGLVGTFYRIDWGQWPDSWGNQTRNIHWVAILNYATIFIIEIIIGASIFSYFAKHFISFEYWVFLGVIFISIFVFWYVLKGGYAAVTYSDSWQFWLVILGISFSFMAIIVSYGLSGNSFSAPLEVFIHAEGSFWVVTTFLLNALFINILLPTTQVSSWQRFSASTKKSEFKKGYYIGLFLKMFPVLIAAILISAIVFKWQNVTPTFSVIFDLLQNISPFGLSFYFSIIICWFTFCAN